MQAPPLRSLWLRYLSIPVYLVLVIQCAGGLIAVRNLFPALPAIQGSGLPFESLVFSSSLHIIAFFLPAPLLWLLWGNKRFRFSRTELRFLVIACGLTLLAQALFSLIYTIIGTKPNQLIHHDMNDILKYRGAFLFLSSVVVPAYEEWIFRGLLFGVLVTQATRKREAIFASLFISLLFTAAHIEGAESLSALPAIFGMSLVLHAVTWKSGSLWPAFCAHSLQNLLVASKMLAAAAKDAG